MAIGHITLTTGIMRNQRRRKIRNRIQNNVAIATITTSRPSLNPNHSLNMKPNPNPNNPRANNLNPNLKGSPTLGGLDMFGGEEWYRCGGKYWYDSTILFTTLFLEQENDHFS
jgi:hypothetical protein